MNICNKLPLYLYNEMDIEEKKEFEEHIAQCSNCQESIKAFKTLQEEKSLLNAPDAVIESILKKTTRKRHIMPWVFAAAACLFIGIGFFSINRQSDLNNMFVYDNYSLDEISSINSELDEIDSIFLV